MYLQKRLKSVKLNELNFQGSKLNGNGKKLKWFTRLSEQNLSTLFFWTFTLTLIAKCNFYP